MLLVIGIMVTHPEMILNLNSKLDTLFDSNQKLYMIKIDILSEIY